ncbi:hypothetical protein SAMN02745165_02911 [Malonomonas rubra DSM 5091]|uniref:Uncharacterized protein n=1 Tax=Malonomonas rubra DSM 5091 TaxID=1122189 RepID=A0A1M6L889_MALRU|nr:hypothetical protein [Malonomonas rubra]SHJ67403.1 hypothetical protein SAMN02745165_02911 [Malonomonas rubra DSM 5091]
MTAKKAGGGKLTRSETVTVRLDPKLRYLVELAARSQRRTVSSYIEWAIEQSLQKVILFEGRSSAECDVNLAEAGADLWDVDEADRLVRLADQYPEMLTYDEQVLWKLICENGFFWRGKYDDDGDWCWTVDIRKLIWGRLREHWDLLKAVADGEEEASKLPSAVRREEPTFNPDDEIPF